MCCAAAKNTRPPCKPLLSAVYVLVDFVYEFFNLCGSVHRLFSLYYGRPSPDHAVHRRCESGWTLGTGRHDAAASTWTRWDRRRREETRHWWHSPSNNDHNWSESGRGASKVGWFMCFINFAATTPPPPIALPQNAPLLKCGLNYGWSSFNGHLNVRPNTR